MESRWPLLGLAAPIVLCLFTGLSILLSPWFVWEANALSDLGNPANGIASVLFNSGLGISGAVLGVYSILSLKNYAIKTSYFMALTSFFLMLVGIFNESCGQIHTIVSVIMFIFLFSASVFYFIEKKNPLALIAVFGMLSWLLYLGRITGAAIPEAVSWLAATPWIVFSARSFLLYGKSK